MVSTPPRSKQAAARDENVEVCYGCVQTVEVCYSCVLAA
jgi:hypothetical protein